MYYKKSRFYINSGKDLEHIVHMTSLRKQGISEVMEVSGRIFPSDHRNLYISDNTQHNVSDRLETMSGVVNLV